MLTIFCAALVTAACASHTGASQILPAAESNFIIDLPAPIIDIDPNGNASINGLSLNTIAPNLRDSLNIQPQQIQQLTARNIQHIQLNISQLSTQQSGLALWINGRSMPSARWDSETLANLIATLDLLGHTNGLTQVAQFLPWTQQITQQTSTGIILRFPKQAGAIEIPFDNTNADSLGVTAQQTRDNFLASVGRSPVVRIPVTYDQSGTWRVNNLTENEYMVLLPGFPWNALHLSQASIAALKANKISQLAIGTDPNGLHLRLNDQPLPYITWSKGELHNLIQLLDETNLLAENGITLTREQQQLFIETILPLIQASDFQLTVNFPE